VASLIDWLTDHWRLAAIASLFFVGVVLRRTGIAGAAQGRWLLNFVFYVGLPILIFGALSGATLSREHALLPVVAVATALIGWAAAAFAARRFGLPKKGEGAMSMCAMSMNISMIYPFASLSLGAPRRFVLRHRARGLRHELLLEPGSLLLMRGATQRTTRHALPRTAKPVGERINLTFRRIYGKPISA